MNSVLDKISVQFLDTNIPLNLLEAIKILESQGMGIEEIGEIISENPAQGLSPKGGKWVKDIWKKILTELTLLICTEDKKYESERKELINETSQFTILSVISEAIAHKLGMNIGVASPMVMLGLKIFKKTTTEGVCSYFKEKFEVKPE
jgi:DNA-binding transcriptional MerR regulator